MSDNPLITKLAERFTIDEQHLLTTLTATAFRQRNDTPPSHEQLMALLLVADQYGLNPFTREIYAFPDKHLGIIPVVGVDGWSRMINQHPQFDGVDFHASEHLLQPAYGKPCPASLTCVIYRKDRNQPIRITEYLDEVYRPPFEQLGDRGPYLIHGPWQSHTKRMLRHKALIQCARLAFGFVGIYDHDEAERRLDGDTLSPAPRVDVTQLANTVQQRITQLVQRAIASQAWDTAQDYATQHFSGDAQRAAQQMLAEARLQHSATDHTAHTEVVHEGD